MLRELQPQPVHDIHAHVPPSQASLMPRPHKPRARCRAHSSSKLWNTAGYTDSLSILVTESSIPHSWSLTLAFHRSWVCVHRLPLLLVSITFCFSHTGFEQRF